ncbi:MAG: AcrR family transcriptional regulator [Bradymonadia bacterium]|jgi:AcrR family transcriptional regulator
MERRHQILVAAAGVLCKRGPSKTTMAEIARAAGVAVGSVYLEFRGKAEVLGALSVLRYGLILDAMREAAAQADPPERVRAALRARLETFIELNRQGAHAPLLLSNYCKAVESAWRWYQTEQLAIVRAALRDGVEAGALRPDAEDLADVILRACATLAPPLLRGTEAQARRNAERLYDVLLVGVVAR